MSKEPDYRGYFLERLKHAGAIPSELDDCNIMPKAMAQRAVFEDAEKAIRAQVLKPLVSPQSN